MPEEKEIWIDKDLRPAYYDDFRCLMAGCRFNCCNSSWRITFDKKDYLTLKRQSGSPELNARLDHSLRRIRSGDAEAVQGFYAEFVTPGGVCPLLKDGLCTLQQEKGAGVLPKVCREFPRIEAPTLFGYLERSLTPRCEGVLELLWNLPEGIAFRSDPFPPQRRIRTVSPAAVPDAWREQAQDIRSACIDLLQDRRAPLPVRILRMGLALKELADGEEDISGWAARTTALPGGDWGHILPEGDNRTLPLFLSNNLFMLLSLHAGRREFSGISEELTAAFGIDILQDQEKAKAVVPLAPYLTARERFEERFGDRGYFWENLAVALFFQLRMPALAGPEELWKSYVNFCNLYSFYRFLSVLSCREGIPESGSKDELFRLLAFASQGLLHNNEQRASLRDNFFQTDSATLAHMAILLGG